MRSRDVIFSLTASMFSATDGLCDQMFWMFVRVGKVARLSTVHRAKSFIDCVFSNSDYTIFAASDSRLRSAVMFGHSWC